MGRLSTRVADCGICGRTELGVVSNYNGEGARVPRRWRVARHRKPDGTWCIATEPTVVYEAPPKRVARRSLPVVAAQTR